MTGTNQVKELRVLQEEIDHLGRYMESIVLMMFVYTFIFSYPVQYETCHSPVMCNRLCRPIDCLQCCTAMWAYSATCWLHAEHTVPTTVKVPLVDSLNR